MNSDVLLGQQVIGFKASKDKWVLDEDVVSILRMMYPEFRLVKGVFDIYPDDSFIYIGDSKYINSVKNKPNPHIIVATTGINLLDREVMLECVYEFLGKSVPKTVKDIYKLWDDSTFYSNLKFLLVLKSIPDKTIRSSNFLLDVVSVLYKGTNFLGPYYTILDSGLDEFEFFEFSFLSFVSKSMNLDSDTTSSGYMYNIRSSFVDLCGKNVSQQLLIGWILILRCQNLDYLISF